MLWGEDDIFGRWLQAVCAVVLTVFSIIGGYIVISHIGLFLLLGGVPVIYGSSRLAWRCAYYAVTGKNNVNERDF